MNSPPDAVFAAVRDTDPDTLDSGELDGYLRHVAELRAWGDARQVRATRRQRQLADEGRAAEPRNSLAEHGRHSSKEANAANERESVCTSMPGFESALGRGSVAARHVDAIAGATKNLDAASTPSSSTRPTICSPTPPARPSTPSPETAATLARSIRAQHNARSDVDELEAQQVQSKVSRWVDRNTGMHKTLIECDPITDRKFWSAIQRTRGRLRQRSQRTGAATSWDRLTVDAVVEAVSTEADSAATSRPSIVVHVDVDTLAKGRHDDTLCETDSGVPVPIETMRREACDAHILPVVLDGAGVALDVGRAKRLATAAQRSAIEAMQATCSHPQCTVTIDECRIHHLVPWHRGGTTDLDQMAAVCEVHHHMVHEGGWTLTMTPDRVATWTRPDGVVHWTGSLNDRRAATTAS